MFDTLAKQLELYTVDNKNKNFSISEEEFEIFCKEFLFEELKNNSKLGEAFCKKYNESNYVLSILHNDSAKKHIRKFYVK